MGLAEDIFLFIDLQGKIQLFFQAFIHIKTPSSLFQFILKAQLPGTSTVLQRQSASRSRSSVTDRLYHRYQENSNDTSCETIIIQIHASVYDAYV